MNSYYKPNREKSNFGHYFTIHEPYCTYSVPVSGKVHVIRHLRLLIRSVTQGTRAKSARSDRTASVLPTTSRARRATFIALVCRSLCARIGRKREREERAEKYFGSVSKGTGSQAFAPNRSLPPSLSFCPSLFFSHSYSFVRSFSSTFLAA